MANAVVSEPAWQNNEVEVGVFGSSAQLSVVDVEESRSYNNSTNVEVVTLHTGDMFRAHRVEPVGSLLLLHGAVPSSQDAKVPWVSIGSVQEWSRDEVVCLRTFVKRPKVVVAQVEERIYQATDYDVVGNKVILRGTFTTMSSGHGKTYMLMPTQVGPLVLYSWMLDSYEELELAPATELKSRVWDVVKLRGGAEFCASEVTSHDGCLSLLQPVQLYTLTNGEAAYVSMGIRCLEVRLPEVTSWTHAAKNSMRAQATMKVEVVEMQDGAIYAATRVRPAGSRLLLYGAVRVVQDGVVLRQKTVLPELTVSLGSLADWRQAQVSKDMLDDGTERTITKPMAPKALVLADTKLTSIMGDNIFKPSCFEMRRPVVAVRRPLNRDVQIINQKALTTSIITTTFGDDVITYTAGVNIPTSLMTDFTQSLPQAAVWLLRCVTRTFPKAIAAASNDVTPGHSSPSPISTAAALRTISRQHVPHALLPSLAYVTGPVLKAIIAATNIMPCHHLTSTSAPVTPAFTSAPVTPAIMLPVTTDFALPVPDALAWLLSRFNRTFPKAITAAGNTTVYDKEDPACRLMMMVGGAAVNGLARSMLQAAAVRGGRFYIDINNATLVYSNQLVCPALPSTRLSNLLGMLGGDYSQAMHYMPMWRDRSPSTRLTSAFAFITVGPLLAAFHLTDSSIAVLSPMNQLSRYPLAIANSAVACNSTSRWFAAKFVIANHPELTMQYIRSPFNANTLNTLASDVPTELTATVCILTNVAPAVLRPAALIRAVHHIPRHTNEGTQTQRYNVHRLRSPSHCVPSQITLADEHSDDEAAHEMHSLNIQSSLKAAVEFARSSSYKAVTIEGVADTSSDCKEGTSSDSDVEGGGTPLSDCSSNVWTDDMPSPEGLRSPATPTDPKASYESVKLTGPVPRASDGKTLDDNTTTDSESMAYDSDSDDWNEDVDEPPVGVLSLAMSGVRTAVHWGVCWAGVGLLLQTASWLLDMPADV